MAFENGMRESVSPMAGLSRFWVELGSRKTPIFKASKVPPAMVSSAWRIHRLSKCFSWLSQITCYWLDLCKLERKTKHLVRYFSAWAWPHPCTWKICSHWAPEVCKARNTLDFSGNRLPKPCRTYKSNVPLPGLPLAIFNSGATKRKEDDISNSNYSHSLRHKCSPGTWRAGGRSLPASERFWTSHRPRARAKPPSPVDVFGKRAPQGLLGQSVSISINNYTRHFVRLNKKLSIDVM